MVAKMVVYVEYRGKEFSGIQDEVEKRLQGLSFPYSVEMEEQVSRDVQTLSSRRIKSASDGINTSTKVVSLLNKARDACADGMVEETRPMMIETYEKVTHSIKGLIGKIEAMTIGSSRQRKTGIVLQSKVRYSGTEDIHDKFMDWWYTSDRAIKLLRDRTGITKDEATDEVANWYLERQKNSLPQSKQVQSRVRHLEKVYKGGI